MPTSPRNAQPLRVGFIGLGIMGRPMAANLLAAGFPLTVHDLSPDPVAALAALGATPAASAREVAVAGDVIIVMVATADDLAGLIGAADGLAAGVAPGGIVAAMGTHAPSAIRAMAADVRRRGFTLIDAPVSGGEVGAKAGTLSIMVGGPKAAVGRAWPVLSAMGTPFHVGGIGAGQVAKACNQLIVGSTIEAVAEALTLAAAAGVDPVRVRDAMRGGYAASRVLELHGERMLEGDFVPGGRAALHLKDARIVCELATQLGVPLPGFDPVANQFERLVAGGGGGLDHAALITLLGPAAARVVRSSPPAALADA